MILSKPDGLCTIEIAQSKKVAVGFHTEAQAQAHRNAIVELCVNQSVQPKTLQFHFAREDSISDIAQIFTRSVEMLRLEAVELDDRGHKAASDILFTHANAIVRGVNEALINRKPIF